MFYHKQYNKVLEDFRKGVITIEIAHKRIISIENRAYKIALNPEPDGDITYAAACVIEEIKGN